MAKNKKGNAFPAEFSRAEVICLGQIAFEEIANTLELGGYFPLMVSEMDVRQLINGVCESVFPILTTKITGGPAPCSKRPTLKLVPLKIPKGCDP